MTTYSKKRKWRISRQSRQYNWQQQVLHRLTKEPAQKAQ
ncbi:hypothetical protein QFZ20_000715 [Flavobacterium sp. W4I14]|nr:hypothetical protein [Flavobacterium sp. W4I14]